MTRADDLERLHFEAGKRRSDRQGLTVEDEHNELFARLLAGRTIVKAERDPHSGEDWTFEENSVQLTLDDGAELTFTGMGYDASSLITTYHPAATTTCQAHITRYFDSMGDTLSYVLYCALPSNHEGEHDSHSNHAPGEEHLGRWLDTDEHANEPYDDNDCVI